jgi:hypothetical protein
MKSPLSSSSSVVSSDSDSVEIIDHRSPNNFRTELLVSDIHVIAKDTMSDGDITVDEEGKGLAILVICYHRFPGWIRMRSSSPQPIPALHGPLSLPYARCPSLVVSHCFHPFLTPSQRCRGNDHVWHIRPFPSGVGPG